MFHRIIWYRDWHIIDVKQSIGILVVIQLESMAVSLAKCVVERLINMVLLVEILRGLRWDARMLRRLRWLALISILVFLASIRIRGQAIASLELIQHFGDLSISEILDDWLLTDLHVSG